MYIGRHEFVKRGRPRDHCWKDLRSVRAGFTFWLVIMAGFAEAAPLLPFNINRFHIKKSTTPISFRFAQPLATQRNRIMHHDAMEVRVQRARGGLVAY